MVATVHRLLRDEEGATVIEYGLILLLIAMAVVGVAGTVGGALVGIFTAVAGDF
jgi:pilus assembly protein Flp/PilA